MTVPPARVGRLAAAAAGLDPHAVYCIDHANGAGTTDRTKDGLDNRPDNLDRYATALEHADQRVDVRRPGSTSPSLPRSRSASWTPSAVRTSCVGAGRAPGRRGRGPRLSVDAAAAPMDRLFGRGGRSLNREAVATSLATSGPLPCQRDQTAADAGHRA